MLSNEDGMTLPEVLVTITIALIISLAAFALIDTVMRLTGEVQANVDTTQRGRRAMDDMTRELRSQVCVTRTDVTMTDARAIYEATKTSVTFFADLSDESYRTAAVEKLEGPTLRTLEMTGSTLRETITKGQYDNDIVVDGAKFTGGATSRRDLLTTIQLRKQGATEIPVFKYFAFDTNKQTTRELVPSPSLSATQLEEIARIEVSFRVNPTTKRPKRGWTDFKNDVYVRIADPNADEPKPECD
jgi:prepilin-type N-terminal cleavage/methylation domain-containing protein